MTVPSIILHGGHNLEARTSTNSVLTLPGGAADVSPGSICGDCSNACTHRALLLSVETIIVNCVPHTHSVALFDITVAIMMFVR